MKRFVALLLLLLACPLFLFGQVARPLVPADPGVAVVTPSNPVEAGPQAALRKMTRAERKLARDVIADAAEAAGMRRLEFMRAVDRGDQYCKDELKMSLAAHDEAREIDIERLQEILQMILDFISQLLALFGMFADNAVPPVDLYLCSLEAWPAGPCDGGLCAAPFVGKVATALVRGDRRRAPVRGVAALPGVTGGAVRAPLKMFQAGRSRRMARRNCAA